MKIKIKIKFTVALVRLRTVKTITISSLYSQTPHMQTQLKIFGKKISRKFHKAKLEIAALATIYVACYSVLGIISNLEMTMYMGGCV